MTVSSVSSTRQCLPSSLTRSSPSPFKLTGHVNVRRHRMFSTFEFVSDPLPITTPAPRGTKMGINPFTTTTLPSPLTLSNPSTPSTLYFQPRTILPPPPAPSRPTPPYHHHGLTSLRARAFPTHFPSAPAKTLSLSYVKDIHWQSHPLIEASPTRLYRDPPHGTAQGVWKATTIASSLFSDVRDGEGGDEVRGKKGRVGRKGQVLHMEPWRGTGGMRVVGDRAQLGGGVEVYRLSPFERTEPVHAKLTEDGTRNGYRVSAVTRSIPMKC